MRHYQNPSLPYYGNPHVFGSHGLTSPAIARNLPAKKPQHSGHIAQYPYSSEQLTAWRMGSAVIRRMADILSIPKLLQTPRHRTYPAPVLSTSVGPHHRRLRQPGHTICIASYGGVTYSCVGICIPAQACHRPGVCCMPVPSCRFAYMRSNRLPGPTVVRECMVFITTEILAPSGSVDLLRRGWDNLRREDSP